MDYDEDSDDDEFLQWDMTNLDKFRNYVAYSIDHENFVLSNP